jgi:hypothetical protein
LSRIIRGMGLIKADGSKAVSKVKGPIRCHKCQLMCRDAEHYLGHTCNPRPISDSLAFSSLASASEHR